MGRAGDPDARDEVELPRSVVYDRPGPPFDGRCHNAPVARSDAPRVYLAGPLGFTAVGRAFHATDVVPRVREAGFVPLDPWDVPARIAAAFSLPKGDPGRAAALRTANRAAGRRNAAMIARADAVLAILDGTDVDSGTAAEIGYAAALHKPVVGLRMDVRVTGDNEATIVNLQVEWFIRESGGRVLDTNIDDAIAALTKVLRRTRP
jgi:nucleoside 2-deoxyribosyltransferase